MTRCFGTDEAGCPRCESGLDFDFTMAYQPIFDLDRGEAFAYEALVRGVQGESAGDILSRVKPREIYSFDQACRVRALEVAGQADCDRLVSINFLPNAVYEPHSCIQGTLEIANDLNWPLNQIMFEVTETEYVRDRCHLQNIVSAYKAMGFWTAIDDFGSGFANLDLLVDLRPDVVKIDRHLISHIDSSPRRQAIFDGVVLMCERLNIEIIAEGVETAEEAAWLYSRGIVLQQGYYYAYPAIETLPGCDTQLMDCVREASAFVAEPA